MSLGIYGWSNFTELTSLASLNRYGHDLTDIFWILGTAVSAPAAGTVLVSYTVPASSKGYVYGLQVNASEGNTYQVEWTSGGTVYDREIVVSGSGTFYFTDVNALNEGFSADAGTVISVKNKNDGSSGSTYTAHLFVGYA